MKGRKAELYFQGKGYKSELPIILIQGEVEENLAYTVDVEQEPRGDYAAKPVFDVTEVAALLNADPADLTFSLVEPKTGEPTVEYTGNEGELLFWCDAEGNNNGWNGAFAYVAYWPAEKAIVVCPHPNTGNDTTGKAVVRLTNAEGKYAEFTLNIHFIKEEVIYKPEIIKTIEISHLEKAATAYCEDEPAPTFDVAEVCAALGIADMSEAKAYIVNLTDGNFVENTTDGWRDANGDAMTWSQATNGFCLKLNNPASGEFDYTGAHDANFQVGDTYVAQWGIVANEKAVLLKVTITFVDDPAGINEINADENADAIFNINGVQIVKPQQKGIYIQNGKKVVIK